MATMFRKVKDFYCKADFDYSADYIDPFEYHETFYLILKAFNVTNVGNTKTKVFDQNLFIFITGAIGVIATSLSIYHGLHNFDILFLTESGTYFIILSYKVLIISSSKVNLAEYHNILKAMHEDFLYICGPGNKYKERFFENQFTTWKACIFIVVFTFGMALGIFVTACAALTYFLITYTPDEEKNRPLLFPFWLNNVDFHKSPAYEIAFIFSCVCTLSFGYNYIFMIQTQIMWVRHIIAKANIVIWSIEDLFEGVHPNTNEEEKRIFTKLLHYRMKEIVIKHQSMYRLIDDYSKVYKKFLLYEQSLCGPTVCLTAYCSAEKLSVGEFPMILILLCISTCVLYYIPNHLCTLLDLKVKSICDACWGTPFWNCGTVICPYLVLIMQRSLQPLPLKIPGFQDTSIETFSKKMSTAYSCFNMLRQANR